MRLTLTRFYVFICHNVFSCFYIMYICDYFIFLLCLSQSFKYRKRSWREKAERRARKRLRFAEQQEYILKRIRRLQGPRREHSFNNFSKSNSSGSNNSSYTCDVSTIVCETSNEAVMVTEEDCNISESVYDHTGNELSISDEEDVALEGNANSISSSENTNDSENENFDVVFENDEQKRQYVLVSLRGLYQAEFFLSVK